MVETRHAKTEDLPRLKELWGAAFGDGEAFLGPFFQKYALLEQVLILCEEGRPQAMLVLLPQALAVGGRQEEVPYVYALTTSRECRGRGYAGRLLEYAGQKAGDRGAAGISTVPAREELHTFFAQEGFREGFVTWEGGFFAEELPQGEGAALRLTAEEYGLERERLLKGLSHVIYPEKQLKLQEMMCSLGGTGLYGVSVGGLQGCAAVERLEDGTVLAKELLCPGHTLEGLGALANVLPARRYVVRSPKPWAEAGGELRRFGMVRPLRGNFLWEDGCYLGLAFD